ncbi:ankyrin repeat-containing domain protein [Hyaloraphidium curvatum]|nr:ankyrin repeat-containing domain protein [Hyaloraphidium curvatum]
MGPKALTDEEKLLAVSLHAACREGDALRFEKLLADARVDVNARDEHKSTAFILACEEDKVEILRLLLKHPEVHVNAKDTDRRSGFMKACANGHADVIELLLADGRAVIQATDGTCTGFIYACRNGKADVVKLLLGRRKDIVNAKDDMGRTGFMAACALSHVDVVRLMVEDPRVDVNATHRGDKLTAFMYACLQGNVDVLRVLLADARVDLDAKGQEGCTGFMLACGRSERTDVIRLLMSHERINVNAKSNDGSTGFLYACQWGVVANIQLLLADERVDVNSKDSEGWSGLIHACENGHKDVVVALLGDSRIDVNAKDNDGWTGFISACKSGSCDILRVLLAEPKVDVNAKDYNGRTGFIVACADGAIDVIKLLVDPSRADSVVDLNATDRNGWTGFIHACRFGKMDVVKHLLGDPKIDPIAVAEVARVTGSDGIEKVLRRPTAFILACWYGHVETVSLLLASTTVDVNQPDADGNTGFIHACKQKHREVALLLLENKERVDITVRNKEGWSAADVVTPEMKRLIELEMRRAKEPEGLPSAQSASPNRKKRIAAGDVKYDEADFLGAGGFGKVYRGVLRGATAVAVKTIKGAVEPRTIKMFLKEIEVWESLDQRNILPLLAYCESPPMMISEFCAGGNMRKRLEDLNWDQAVGIRYLKGVGDGMAYLHSFHVLHGDLKSLNIMIDHDIPKIADFGLSRIRTELSKSSTVGAGAVQGTEGFIAPELYEGEPLRAPADVYAFAMVCYEVTSEGMYPFGGLPTRAIMRKVCDKSERPFRPFLAEDDMWALMKRMWVQRAVDRPTFVEVVAEMSKW